MSENLYNDLSVRRKELQAKGYLPEWFITPGLQLWEEKYEHDTETSVKGQFERIARTAASHLPEAIRQVANDKFFELLWKGWLSPSTPVMSNMGTNKGLVVSCAGSVVDDSIDGFYSSLREAALLTKYGFGTSSYLGDIRPRGTPIAHGGKASGVVPVFEDFVNMTSKVTQGTSRRGAWSGYLPISHGDFDELSDHVSANPDGANVGWNLYDNDLINLNNGELEVTRRWKKTMKTKMVNGAGYFFFPDKANRKSPECYKKLDLIIKASNLCFTGDTLVATADGRNAVSIEQLAFESNGEYEFNVYSSRWNPNKKMWVTEIQPAIAFCTGDKEVIELILSDGGTFKCTPGHKLALKDGTYREAQQCIGSDLTPFYTSLGGSIENVEGLTVDSIRKCGIEMVYDLTVKDNHNFNVITKTNDELYSECSGILVHNCSEIALASGIDTTDNLPITFSCVLSSMNVAWYNDWKNTDAVYWSTIFLDCVAEDFLQNARNIKGLEQVVRFTERGRALGLG